jgi:hypothetical protein
MDAIGEQRFVEIREALESERTLVSSRDAFLLQGVVGNMLRDLMPEDAPAEAVNAYGSLLHMFYLCWSHGWPVAPVTAGALKDAVAARTPETRNPAPRTPVYIQLPERLVWAEPVRGAAHEPVDGVFLVATAERASALAVLGLREEREGYTTAEASFALPLPLPAPRLDGSAPFASLLPGGERAGLLSIASELELVALALLALAAPPR